MNSVNSNITGGASIIPRPRRSIHSHLNCPFATSSNMVSYGLTRKNRNLERNDSDNEQGNDEVDNAMSKPMHPITSSPRDERKRNSFSAENKLYTEDDRSSDEPSKLHTAAHHLIARYLLPSGERQAHFFNKKKCVISNMRSNELSKSLPAALPSYSHYSDSSQEGNGYQAQYNSSNVSYQSIRTPDRSFNRSFNISNPRVLETSRTVAKKQHNGPNNAPKITIIFIFGIIVAAALSTLNIADNYVTKLCPYNQFNFYTDLGGLGEKYNVDEYSILQVQTAISTIVKKQDTGSFMFVYNTDESTFNLKDFNKFMHDVSLAASKYLRNDSNPIHYTMVEGTKLDMVEHRELIARYREDLDKTGLMLVKHVEDIPSGLAMAFHYYCDEYNPLVKKSAIFFTLNLAKCPNKESVTKSNHELVEKCLASKWGNVPLDSIGPLLTRVVGVVVDVTRAFR